MDELVRSANRSGNTPRDEGRDSVLSTRTTPQVTRTTLQVIRTTPQETRNTLESRTEATKTHTRSRSVLDNISLKPFGSATKNNDQLRMQALQYSTEKAMHSRGKTDDGESPLRLTRSKMYISPSKPSLTVNDNDEGYRV
jgi:hypothetical protein